MNTELLVKFSCRPEMLTLDQLQEVMVFFDRLHADLETFAEAYYHYPDATDLSAKMDVVELCIERGLRLNDMRRKIEEADEDTRQSVLDEVM